MPDGRWRISVTTPDWGQDHLSSEAVAAFVDGELAPGPHARATQHLQQCAECAAQVAAQTQARSALRTAGCPLLSSALLSSLRAIPQESDLPAPPPGLAVTVDGQFVSVMRPDVPAPDVHALAFPVAGFPAARSPECRAPEHRGSEHRALDHRALDHRALDHRALEHRALEQRASEHRVGTRPGPPSTTRQRRLRLGTGVAVSGLALGAIAFGAPSGPSSPPPAAPAVNRTPGAGTPNVLDARFQIGTSSRPLVERGNPAGFDR